MRRMLFCAAVLALPLCGHSILYGKAHVEEECCEPPPFDADLFRRDAQVFSVHGEFLYWTVNEGSLGYALKMQNPAWGPTPSYAQGTMESGTYNWDPGFRIALSYFRAPRYWEVKSSYTRVTFDGTNHCNKPSPDGDYLTGTWPQIVPAPLAGAKSYLHMNYNLYDITISRFYNPNPHLRLRVVAGFIVPWIDQDWKVTYWDSAQRNTVIQNRWRFVGGGMKSGMTFDWYWGNNVYMTGMGNIGVAVGSYTNRSRQTTNYQPDPADDTSVPIRNMKIYNTRPAFMAQMLFGPSYQKNFDCSRLELFIGYEFNAWANLNEIYHSTASGPFGSKETWNSTSWTGLQGLTFRTTVDF